MTRDTEQNRDTLIQIFTRTPIEGEVKTRLIPRLGAQSSCELHKRMTLHTLQVATHASPAVEIWCTPDCSHPFFCCYPCKLYYLIFQDASSTGWCCQCPVKLSIVLNWHLLKNLFPFKAILIYVNNCGPSKNNPTMNIVMYPN